jgi:hypothetical protein
MAIPWALGALACVPLGGGGSWDDWRALAVLFGLLAPPVAVGSGRDQRVELDWFGLNRARTCRRAGGVGSNLRPCGLVKSDACAKGILAISLRNI